MVTRKTLILPALLAFVAAQASAYDAADVVPHWEAVCNGNAPIKRISFHSDSGRPVEDDMTVTVEWTDHRATVLPLQKAWYLKRMKLSEQGGGCEGIGVHLFGPDKVLLVLAFDGRPGGDHLAVALVNPSAHTAIDTVQDLGEIPDSYDRSDRGALLGFAVFKSWRRARNGGEEGVPQWRDVSVQKGRLHVEWRK